MKTYRIILFFSFLTMVVHAETSQKLNYTFYANGQKTDEKKGTFLLNDETKYGNGKFYGLDFGTKINSKQPFFFSLDVPEGNYLVIVVLGSNDAEANTTVKAESRRLMLENIHTAKGELKKYSFVVNIRNTKLGADDSVRIKKREIGALIWDNKLTLEFDGTNPSVVSIKIQKVDNLLTLFIAGDSTVVDQPDQPWTGWGQILTRFMNDHIAVANYAESGEAANTFVSSKRFAKLLSKMRKGDYLFIQFSHNDEKQKGSGQGPYTSYTKNLKYLVDGCRKKGGIPILITPMHRRTFDENGKIVNSHGDYPDAMRQLAKEENVPLIDLLSMSKLLYEAWGEEDSKKAFVHYPKGTFPGQEAPLADNSHFNPYGGYEIAKCVVQGIIDINLPIKKYIKDFTTFDPSHPDRFDKIHYPATPFVSTTKPDGN